MTNRDEAIEDQARIRAVLTEWAEATRTDAQDEILLNHREDALSDVAFAHAFLRCGGTTPEGREFKDLVRATFCLRKESGRWLVAHQHMSAPHT